MKKLLLIFSLLLIPLSTNAQFEFEENWNIIEFNSEIQINKDSSIDVRETIVVDFSREAHHGIFRDIPFIYENKDGEDFTVDINIESITDPNGVPYQFEEQRSGDNKRFKIGDPTFLVNDVITYVIKYNFSYGILFQEDYDELYWNSTGTDWPVPIDKATTKVFFPEEITDLSKVDTICFTGRFASTSTACEHKILDSKTAFYQTTRSLESFQGLTIGLKLPKGLIDEPSFLQKNSNIFLQILFYFIPILLGVHLYKKWQRDGKDPETRGTIIPYYFPPKDISAGEAGVIKDEKSDISDITATVIELAVKKFITIEEEVHKTFIFKTKTFTFICNNIDWKDLKPHEVTIMKTFFGANPEKGKERTLDSLKNEFYKTIPEVKSDLYEEVQKNGYFVKNPESARSIWGHPGSIGFSILLGFIAAMFYLEDPFNYYTHIIIALAICVIVAFIFFRAMPKKTQKGIKAYENILGIKEFIKTADKDRIKFYEKENIFERNLPYAIMFGMSDKWVKAFEGLDLQKPDWYMSDTVFTAHALNSSLNSLSSGMTNAFVSQPGSAGGSSFGGGGFSGGGFGGGGGGAW